MKNVIVFLVLIAGVLGGGCRQMPARTSVADRIAQCCRIVSQDEWFGHPRVIFEFDGEEAWVVEPAGGAAAGNPWTWTMEWPSDFELRTGAVEMLRRGWWHVTLRPGEYRDGAFVSKPGNMTDVRLRRSRAFQKFLVETLGFAPKANLIGMSWGGFYSIRYAATYPACVRKAYLDAPLCDFTSLPPCWTNYVDCSTWGVTPDYRGANDPRMPINMAKPIAEAGIEILLLYGGQDSLCLPDRNCEVFARRFKECGGKLRNGIRDDGNAERRLFGHHPHGVEESMQGIIAEFFEHGIQSKDRLE